MSPVEQQIAAALTARAGGITMDTSTMEERFAEVRARGVQDRRRRRGTTVVVTALATAAAVAAAFALGSGLLTDEEALPPAQPPAADVVVTTQEVFPLPGTTYGIGEPFLVPFTFSVPDKGSVTGKWRIGPPEARGADVGLDNAPVTGYANVRVAVPEQVYDPTQPKPFSTQGRLVPAPVGADGWQQWLEATQAVQITERTELDIDGVPAVRFGVDVADDLPQMRFPCVGGESCLAISPQGPALLGSNQAFAGFAELTVLDVDGQTVIAVSSGAERSVDQWLPLMRTIIDGLRFG